MRRFGWRRTLPIREDHDQIRAVFSEKLRHERWAEVSAAPPTHSLQRMVVVHGVDSAIALHDNDGNRLAEGGAQFIPFAMLFSGNPYEAVNPPNPDGGFYSQEEVHV
ncbi:MAG: hypothetical protein NTY19_22505 [Planctomycetota bacterium]|nr:hypothetical protein [Planctomycetota bacterium]